MKRKNILNLFGTLQGGGRRLTLSKYQALEAITSDKKLSDIDKTLYSICALYDYAPEELDKEKPLKVIKMAAKLEKIFKFKIKAPVFIGIYKMSYDISSITFGQYIELSYFFQGDALDKSNFIAASMSRTFRPSKHIDRAKYFLKCSVGKVAGAMQKIRSGFLALNKEFSGLFGLDEEVNEASFEDPFMQQFQARYGWIFSAEMVAAYERISIDETYKLPVKVALNDLMYIKAKGKYQYLLNKK